jgi:hypothetical protein
LKNDEGVDPKKVGSLFGDKPISSLFETLRYKDSSFPRKVLPKVRKRKRA